MPGESIIIICTIGIHYLFNNLITQVLFDVAPGIFSGSQGVL